VTVVGVPVVGAVVVGLLLVDRAVCGGTLRVIGESVTGLTLGFQLVWKLLACEWVGQSLLD
jgi:hypothetical protein